MEKPPTTKSINKILKKISQASVSFQNPHSFSPRDHHHHNKRLNSSNLNKGFSGSIIPNIPNERSSKNNSYESTQQEPTSPKISCMGQIKYKHKMCKQQKKKILQSHKRTLTKSVSYLTTRQIERTEPQADDSKKKKKPPSGMSKLFGSSRGRKSDVSVNEYSEPRLQDRAPSLSQMKRFASSRDTLAGFDWTSVRNGSDDEDDDDDFIIPFSAPIMVIKHGDSCGGDGVLEPRKEINLWKRRTMAQPMPLRLDTL